MRNFWTAKGTRKTPTATKNQGSNAVVMPASNLLNFELAVSSVSSICQSYLFALLLQNRKDL